MPHFDLTCLPHKYPILSCVSVGPKRAGVIQDSLRPSTHTSFNRSKVDHNQSRQIFYDSGDLPLSKMFQINNKAMLRVILLGLMAPFWGDP
jgi:hypothetical protein